MGSLHQIVAVEKGIKNRVKTDVDTLYKAVQKAALFNGFSKTYAPLTDEGTKLPAEAQKVQFTASQMLKSISELMSETLTIEARKDWTNCLAKADVVVDGATILEGAPISYLLFLEKQLVDVRTFVGHIPVLDSAEDWTLDANSGLNKTAVAQTHRNEKVQEALVLIAPTDKHPGNAQLITKDVLAGYWNLTKMSGAISKPAKDALLARIEKITDAVKIAREEANNTEEDLTAPNAGKAVFSYILGAVTQ